MSTNRLIALLGFLGAALLASCGEKAAVTEGSDDSTPPAPAKATPPAAPSAEVLAALQAQEFGRKLLGKTVLLVGDEFVPADLTKAPEFYLVHYSASW